MLQMGFVYELPWMRESSGVLAMLLKAWQINGIGSWVSGAPFTVGGDNGLLQQAGGYADGQRHGRARRAASVRPARTSRGTTRASSASRATRGATRAATRSAGRRTGTSTSRCSGRFPIRPLPHGVPCGVDQRVQPHAVGQPGHRLDTTRTSCVSVTLRRATRAACSSACASRSSQPRSVAAGCNAHSDASGRSGVLATLTSPLVG